MKEWVKNKFKDRPVKVAHVFHIGDYIYLQKIDRNKFIMTGNGIADINLKCISKDEKSQFQAYREFNKCVFQKHQNFTFQKELQSYVKPEFA